MARVAEPPGMAGEVTGDVAWVIEKGGLYDPFTQDDAGGAPASQFRPIHHPVLPAGCRRLRGLFSQTTRPVNPAPSAPVPSLPAQRAEAAAADRQAACRRAALFLPQDLEAPLIPR